MFVSDRLLFVAAPKTGCTHILSLLSGLVPGVRRGNKHALVEPVHFQPGRRFVGSIRSPWTWYVSLWAFGCRGMGGLRTSISRHGMAREFYGDPKDPRIFRRWLHLLLDDHEATHGTGLDFGGSPLGAFAGLATIRYCRFFLSPASRDRVWDLPDYDALLELDRETAFIDDFIHQERLEDDLIAVLDRCGHPLTPEQRARVRESPRTNVSPWTRDPADYYDAELIERVTEKDRFLLERFGYAWGATDDFRDWRRWETPALRRASAE